MNKFLLTATALAAATARGHVRQRVYYEGVESIVAWPAQSIRMQMHQFSGNVGESSTATSIDFATARTIVGASISQWTGSGVTLFGGLTPSLTLDLDTGGVPYAGSSSCEYTTSGTTDGINNFIFTSKIGSTSCAGTLAAYPGVIGLTKVAFRPSSGEIVEADIQFDDKEFLFKTSGSHNLNPGGSNPKQIVLKDVVVHELGHFFGLDHSAAREATMLFAVADDLQTTKRDDQMGLFSLYPPSGLSASTGAAKGSVTVGGTGVFGAAVFFLNPRTLKPNAHEVTDVNGAFEFCALPAGPQVVFASSYLPYGTNIHDYYSGDGSGGATVDGECTNPACALMTTSLKRSWFSHAPSGGGSGGVALNIVSVPAGGTAQYVNLAGLNGETSLAQPATNEPLALDEPRVARLSTGTIPLNGQSSNVGTHTYTFVAPSSGNVQIRTASLGIYARLRLKIELFDSTPTDITSSSCPLAGGGEAMDEPTTSDPSADVAYARDPWLNCTGLTSGGTYTIRITGTGAHCADIPGNKLNCWSLDVESASTAIPYYILTVFETSKLADTTLAGASLDAASSAATTYSGMPTCGAKSGTVASGTTSGTTKKKGCCGTLGNVPGGPSGPASLLLTLALNPLLWFAAWWGARGRRIYGNARNKLPSLNLGK